MDDHESGLITVLRRSQRLGYIGGTDLDVHIRHAEGFQAVFSESAPQRAMDLGSGGGLPGLVLAMRWPESHWVLLDGSQTRTTFLDHAVNELDLGTRVQVVRGRAEEQGHEESLRGQFDAVFARSFGPPAVVAECAAPFLAVSGTLVVSEPPESGDRWDHAEPLAELGLVVSAGAATSGYQALTQERLCPDRYPRRVGIPMKRPLF